MRACVPLLSLLYLALGVGAPSARAEVYQCVGPDGSLLLTDSGCPAGFHTRFVALEAQRVVPVEATAEPPPVPTFAAKSEAQRLAAAEAEAALLRVQLEGERLRLELVQEQLILADRQLDAQTDPMIGYGVAGPILVPGVAWYPQRHGKVGKLGHDAKPVEDRGAAPRVKTARVIPHDRWRDCGTFGCTPFITRAPSDDTPRARDVGRSWRPGISGAPLRSTVRPVSARSLRPN